MDDLEETTIEETPETDNSQDSEGEEEPLAKEEPQDRVEKRNAERIAWYQALADKAEARALKSDIARVQQDASVFLEAYNEDPKYAEKIAKALNYANAQEVLDLLKAKDTSPKGFTEDDIEKIVSEREAKKEHEKAITKAEKILDKLPEDLREEAQKRFDKISKGQMLDEETAIEFAEMATLYVNKDNLKADLYNDSLAMLGSSWVGKSKKNAPTAPQYVVRDGELVLISNN